MIGKYSIMKIKTSELLGLQLDWVVAYCEGKGNEFLQFRKAYPSLTAGPSNDWSQGGPIIEREGIDVSYVSKSDWFASKRENHEKLYFGISPLVAAMRCFVASKLGDEVEISEELSLKQ